MPSLKRAVVWGASGHAVVVANAARLSGRYQVVGFIDELAPGRRGEAFSDSRVVGGQEALNELRAVGVDHVLLGVGDNRARMRIAAEVERLGFYLGTVVHPSAVVAADVELSAGVLVSAGAVVNPAARVGKGTVINTGAVVEHHCELGDGVHIAPRAVLGGSVRVGRLSWIGIGAVVIEKIEIGDETQVGAGAVVVRNLASRVLAYGVPAVTKRQIA